MKEMTLVGSGLPEEDAATGYDVGQPGVEMLAQILKKTVATIEEGKGQISDIYENSRREVDLARKALSEIKRETKETIALVDKLEVREQQEKQNLVRVSANFADFSEERIKATYEAVRDVQVRLGVAREKEHRLRKMRDEYEHRLYQMQKTVVGAEQLSMRIASVLNYLSSQMSDVVAQMEKASQNRFLSAAIIRAQENERFRVSREIHDGPAQDVANLMFQASICERLIDIDPLEAKENIQELRRQLKGCLTDIRQIIFDMRPMSLDDLGLVAALRQLTAKLAERQLLKTTVAVDGTEVELPNHISTGMFRIVQEALSNVERHSGVKEASLRILFTAGAVSILVEDQGNGFDVERIERESRQDTTGDGHFGIMGMRERAKIIGAQLNVASHVTHGTRVHLRLPLKTNVTGPAQPPLEKAREAKKIREEAATEEN